MGQSVALRRLSELAAVPLELRELPQWVNWKPEKRGDKVTKVPYDPKSERLASSTNPATWGTWIQGVQALRRDLPGLGFVFAKGGGFVGVDLDHVCNSETGAIEPWALDIIRKLHGYTELSPSGTGVHIIVKGALPEGGRRKGPIEMYDRGRYFTMTGQVLHV